MLFESEDTGSRNWVLNDWASYLDQFFEARQSINKYQSFKTDASRPGVLMCRRTALEDDTGDDWQEFQLKKTKHLPGCKPIRPLTEKSRQQTRDAHPEKVKVMEANRKAARSKITQKIRDLYQQKQMPDEEEQTPLTAFRQWYRFYEIRERPDLCHRDRYYPVGQQLQPKVQAPSN
jgi:hypothetical protein